MAAETRVVAGEYVNSDYDVARCAHKLLCSALFEKHGEYIRKQIVHCLLEVRPSTSSFTVERHKACSTPTNATR